MKHLSNFTNSFEMDINYIEDCMVDFLDKGAIVTPFINSREGKGCTININIIDLTKKIIWQDDYILDEMISKYQKNEQILFDIKTAVSRVHLKYNYKVKISSTVNGEIEICIMNF